jgi:NodT family efflux transporter outer membrane factor (OMF) lipoprotein
MALSGCTWIKIFLTFLFLAALPGCTKVGPDYVRPETNIAPDWLEAGDSRIKNEPADYRNWWRVFKDPALDRLIDTAYQENLDVRRAGVRVLEARAQLGAAAGELYPQTQQAAGSVDRVRQSAGTPLAGLSSGPKFGGVNYWQSQLGLNAGWELDFWGKFRRAVEAADASFQASIADYDNTLVSLTANVATLYTSIRTLERLLAIARENVEIQKESLTITEARFQGGTTSQRDVEQARTVLTSTQATIPVLQLQLRQAKDALSVLLGLPPQQFPDLAKGYGLIPAPPIRVVTGIPADGRISGPRNTTPRPSAPRSASPKPSSTRPFPSSATLASCPPTWAATVSAIWWTGATVWAPGDPPSSGIS